MLCFLFVLKKHPFLWFCSVKQNNLSVDWKQSLWR